MTTSDYLDQLEQDREDLVDNLETQGITGLTGDETFTELVPEVLNIQSGIQPSDIGRTPSSNSSISQYWPSAVNMLYIKSYPTSSVVFTGFLGEEIIFDDNFANTRTYTSFNFKEITTLRKVTKMSMINRNSSVSFNELFRNCSNLREITFGPMIITNLSDMGGICGVSCTSLLEFDASNWNATTVTNGVNLGWAFYVASAIKKVDLSGISGKINTLRQAFQECQQLEEINLSNFTAITQKNAYAAFHVCTKLKKLDIRNLIIHDLTDYTAMFGYEGATAVPANCLIIVKDNTEKAWINNNFNWLTNVKTVAEYEAS